MTDRFSQNVLIVYGALVSMWMLMHARRRWRDDCILQGRAVSFGRWILAWTETAILGRARRLRTPALPRGGHLRTLLEQAGLMETRAEERVILVQEGGCYAAFLIAFGLGLFGHTEAALLAFVVIGATTYVGPRGWLRYAADRRIGAIRKVMPQFIATIRLTSGSDLHGGFSRGLEAWLPRAGSLPFGQELRRLHWLTKLGFSLGQSLATFSDRMPREFMDTTVDPLRSAVSTGPSEAGVLMDEALKSAETARRAALQAMVRRTGSLVAGLCLAAVIAIGFVMVSRGGA